MRAQETTLPRQGISTGSDVNQPKENTTAGRGELSPPPGNASHQPQPQHPQ